MRKYSTDIANAVISGLEDIGLHFDYDEEKGLVDFGLPIKGNFKHLRFVIQMEENGYIVHAMPLFITADKDDPAVMAAMYEITNRINDNLKFGHFEADTDGIITYKFDVLCGSTLPNSDVVMHSVFCPAAMYDQFGDAILAIVFGGSTAGEAFAEWEKKQAG